MKFTTFCLLSLATATSAFMSTAPRRAFSVANQASSTALNVARYVLVVGRRRRQRPPTESWLIRRLQ